MALIVQKYGGSSVADPQKMRNVAERIVATRNRGNDVVVVVSAMGDTTDHLIEMAHAVCGQPDSREMDLLLSTGELVSSALLSMALRNMGQEAVSLSGAQAGIITDGNHRRARITNIQPKRILKELSHSRVVVVAGFQGMTEDMDVTTLGRGASDITAIALAARLDAARCERFTDVEGVFTADPRIEPAARKLKDISYDEMLELASYGAKVMHPRAVELGSVYKVPIFVASSFTSTPGTLIHGGVMVEVASKVRGIAHDNDIAKITIRAVPDRPGAAAGIFQPLSEAGVRVDTVVQNTSQDGVTDLSFTVTTDDLRVAKSVMDGIIKDIRARNWVLDEKVAKVSIVGACLENGIGYAARMFQTLFKAGVNIELITTSPIRITCIIEKTKVPEAVRALHGAFSLGAVAE